MEPTTPKPGSSEELAASLAPSTLGMEPAGAETLELETPGSDAWTGDGARRVLNVLIAVLGLVLALPLLVLIALLIRLTSSGPVLYTQVRIGQDRRRGRRTGGRRNYDLGGRPFLIYKFRTMYVEPVWREEQVWCRRDDPRVTPVGRWLRKYRLDEIPQLFNVVRGEMNIVGPRPEQPRIFDHLREEVAGYAARQKVLPGITGWAQINHHYDESLEDVRTKVRYDLEYIANRSVAMDVRIMMRTVPVIFFRKGAW